MRSEPLAQALAEAFFVGLAGLDAEQSWLVTLSSLEWVFLRTHHAADDSLDCEDLTNTAFDARCQTAEPASAVHLSVVSHAMSERSFTFDVKPVSYADEGTREEPVELALVNLPHAGSVSRKGESLYLVTGLVAGNTYDVGVSGVEENFTLHVMKTGTRLGLCSLSSDSHEPLLPFTCAATPDDTTMQIEILAFENSGTPYSLSVVPR